MDEELEALLLDFEIDPERARVIAQKQDYNYFCEKFERLEIMIGSDAAFKVLQNGQFADYRNSSLEGYFDLAVEVNNLLGDKKDRLNMPSDWYAHFFYSHDTLRQFINRKPEDIEEETSPPSEIFGKYLLFNPGHPQSREYLQTLIQSGELNVGDHEHWARSQSSGTRGENILKKMRYEITQAFHHFGYERPVIEINHGQKKITVSESARERLRLLRDHAYNP
ncbi:MAG: hypothetical protein V1740_00325 [Candidatus Woesearchaeota archaeon]